MEDCIGTFERGTDKFDEVVQGLVAAAGGSGPQLQKALEKVKTIIISHDPRRAGQVLRRCCAVDQIEEAGFAGLGSSVRCMCQPAWLAPRFPQAPGLL